MIPKRRHLVWGSAVILAAAIGLACGGEKPGSPVAVASSTAAVPSAPAAANAGAPLPDPAQLINQLATQGGCRDSTAEMRLSFPGESGQSEQLDFRLQRQYAPERTASLLTVLAPKEEAEKALLAVEVPNQPTAALSYLAGLKRTAKLTSDSQFNFRGTKSTVQELLGLELNQYAAGAPERVMENGASLIRIELKEQEGHDLAFPRIVAYWREGAGVPPVPARFELDTPTGELAKVIRVDEVKPVQGYQTIMQATIDDRQQRRTLTLVTRSIKYDRSLPASLFTEAQLVKQVTEASRRVIE